MVAIISIIFPRINLPKIVEQELGVPSNNNSIVVAVDFYSAGRLGRKFRCAGIG